MVRSRFLIIIVIFNIISYNHIYTIYICVCVCVCEISFPSKKYLFSCSNFIRRLINITFVLLLLFVLYIQNVIKIKNSFIDKFGKSMLYHKRCCIMFYGRKNLGSTWTAYSKINVLQWKLIFLLVVRRKVFYSIFSSHIKRSIKLSSKNNFYNFIKTRKRLNPVRKIIPTFVYSVIYWYFV